MKEQRDRGAWIAVAAFAVGALWSGSAPPAHAGPPMGGGTFVVAQPGKSAGHNVVYVVDEHGQRLLVYEHQTGGKLELSHVRNWEFDAKFQQFPAKGPRAQVPTVREVREAVKGG